MRREKRCLVFGNAVQRDNNNNAMYIFIGTFMTLNDTLEESKTQNKMTEAK